MALCLACNGSTPFVGLESVCVGCSTSITWIAGAYTERLALCPPVQHIPAIWSGLRVHIKGTVPDVSNLPRCAGCNQPSDRLSYVKIVKTMLDNQWRSFPIDRVMPDGSILSEQRHYLKSKGELDILNSGWFCLDCLKGREYRLADPPERNLVKDYRSNGVKMVAPTPSRDYQAGQTIRAPKLQSGEYLDMDGQVQHRKPSMRLTLLPNANGEGFHNAQKAKLVSKGIIMHWRVL